MKNEPSYRASNYQHLVLRDRKNGHLFVTSDVKYRDDMYHLVYEGNVLEAAQLYCNMLKSKR